MSGGPSFAAERGLSSGDASFISKIAFNREFYDRAVDWAEVAVSLADDEEVEKYMKKMLTTMKKHHDKVLDQKGATGSREIEQGVWRTYPVPYDEKLRKKKKYKKKMKKTEFTPELSMKHSTAQTWEHFNQLCAGEQFLGQDTIKRFKCLLLDYSDPYLRLGPFKLDIQHDSPFVGVFRDILYESEMEHYKEFARDKLFRSSVDTKKQVQVTRTSKQTWLEEVGEINTTRLEYYGVRGEVDINDEVAMKISDRISLATRLYSSDRSGGEPYQVEKETSKTTFIKLISPFQILSLLELQAVFLFQIANYGIGGVYNAHPDPFLYAERFRAGGLELDRKMDFITRGDRLATFMGYLSPVELGGATVFPNIGVSIAPEKGSAAFWWSLHNNGHLDWFTVHGGCPVLVGSKW